ncbi:hypothetical protein [Nostoc mirabile]|uniref:hypothetical protein n=1 Tax=Nostoc mirabile TaxID=2907820 RepID=UPI0027DFE457|nr:hypothetical protein [Nostoc mirabile]
MVEGSQGFPHIQLRLTTEGRAASPPGGGKKNPITVVNLGNRQGHGSKLKGSVESLIFDWQITWLRWWDNQGNLLPTGWERSHQTEARSQRLAAKLRELNINPDELV